MKKENTGAAVACTEEHKPKKCERASEGVVLFHGKSKNFRRSDFSIVLAYF
jgi:hypothetical protein